MSQLTSDRSGDRGNAIRDVEALWGEGIVTARGPQGSYEIDLDEHHAEVGSSRLTGVSSQCVGPLLLVRYDGHQQQAKSVRSLLQVLRAHSPLGTLMCITVPLGPQSERVKVKRAQPPEPGLSPPGPVG